MIFHIFLLYFSNYLRQKFSVSIKYHIRNYKKINKKLIEI